MILAPILIQSCSNLIPISSASLLTNTFARKKKKVKGKKKEEKEKFLLSAFARFSLKRSIRFAKSAENLSLLDKEKGRWEEREKEREGESARSQEHGEKLAERVKFARGRKEGRRVRAREAVSTNAPHHPL